MGGRGVVAELLTFYVLISIRFTNFIKGKQVETNLRAGAVPERNTLEVFLLQDVHEVSLHGQEGEVG